MLAVWRDGRQGFLNAASSGERLEFRGKHDAEEAKDFVEMGLEAQSVTVVRLPGPGQQASSILAGAR